LAASHLQFAQERRVAGTGDGMRGAFLGPEYAQTDVERRLTAVGAVFETLDDEGLLDACAQALADGQALGWHQGRMEFGPRALGGRSILGDPRSPTMQKTLNLKVKYRESFRPFAPAVLREHVAEWFDLDEDSPYMLLVADVAERHRVDMTAEQQALFGIDKLNVARSSIPAVTHVDYSARVQTVHRETHPRYHELIRRFAKLTGCPLVVNTSFNVRGEPIVCTPEDAFRCFMGTDIEVLAVGNCLLRKPAQNAALKQNYESAFELD
jgi:carbamoyltransferase